MQVASFSPIGQQRGQPRLLFQLVMMFSLSLYNSMAIITGRTTTRLSPFISISSFSLSISSQQRYESFPSPSLLPATGQVVTAQRRRSARLLDFCPWLVGGPQSCSTTKQHSRTCPSRPSPGAFFRRYHPSFSSTTTTALPGYRTADPQSGHCGGSSSSRYADLPNVTSTTRTITYLTDVEGDRDYLDRYVKQSKVLCWRNVADNEHRDSMIGGVPARYFFPYDHCIDFQKDTGQQLPVMVFGGDVWDQGGSDLYVIRQLLHMKQRYPENVHFVMGNRDINKMRITEELGTSSSLSSSAGLPVHRGVYWLRGTGIAGDPDLEQSSSELSTMDEAVERLKWILKNTMGSPRAFAYRKEELIQEQQELLKRRNNRHITLPAPITDYDVVESYRKSCDPVEGEMSLYLQNANLLLRLGDAAFVHGALPFTRDNLLQQQQLNGDIASSIWDDLSFAMPWLTDGGKAQDVGVESINDWIAALNAFAKSRVQAWVAAGYSNRSRQTDHQIWSLNGGYHNTTAIVLGSETSHWQLMQYGMGSTPGGVRNPTVVYNSWGTSGKPRKFFRYNDTCPEDQSFVRYTKDFFQQTGIRLICSGHQPAGEMPNHIRIDHPGSNSEIASWVLCCDTSYSGDTIWINHSDEDAPQGRLNIGRGSAKSGRGLFAVSEVLIEQCIESGAILHAYCHGTLSDGSRFKSRAIEFDLPATANISSDALMVGTLATDEVVSHAAPHGGKWWTQSALSNGSFLLAAGDGFQFWTRMVSIGADQRPKRQL